MFSDYQEIERVFLALKHAQVGVYEWDLESNRVYLSPEYFILLGHSPGAFDPSPEAWRSLIHPDDLPEVDGVVAEYLSWKRERHSMRYRMKGAHGGWIWVLSRGCAVAGPPRRLMGTHVDVTEQCEVEAELRRSKAPPMDLSTNGASRSSGGHLTVLDSPSVLERAISHAPVSVVITDPEGRLEFGNPCFYRTCGWTAEECLGRPLAFLSSGHQSPRMHREMWQAIHQGQDWHGELCNRRRDGSLYWEQAVLSPVRESVRGPITHVIGILADVTALKEANRLSNELAVELAHRARMAAVGEAVAATAHSVRNLLTTLEGGRRLLSSALESRRHEAASLEEASFAATIIDRGVHRLKVLVLELLEHSKERPANLVVEPIAPMLRDLAMELMPLLPVMETRISVKVEDEELRWPVDRILLERALLNLSINALDSMADRGGVLVLEAKACMASEIPMDCGLVGKVSPEEVVLALGVQDSGIGIAPVDLPHLSRLYYSTKGGRGTGLGLANVRDVVKAHNGALVVSSKPGEGSCFRILLPPAAPSLPEQDRECSRRQDPALPW